MKNLMLPRYDDQRASHFQLIPRLDHHTNNIMHVLQVLRTHYIFSSTPSYFWSTGSSRSTFACKQVKIEGTGTNSKDCSSKDVQEGCSSKDVHLRMFI
jgi:hypothetical protein